MEKFLLASGENREKKPGNLKSKSGGHPLFAHTTSFIINQHYFDSKNSLCTNNYYPYLTSMYLITKPIVAFIYAISPNVEENLINEFLIYQLVFWVFTIKSTRNSISYF